jgi:hypothetical protein
MMPRFQGNALQDENGWYWDLYVSEFGGGQEADKYTTTDRFTTKDEALKNLMEAIKDCINYIATQNPELNIDKGKIIDLKNNEILPMNSQDNH